HEGSSMSVQGGALGHTRAALVAVVSSCGRGVTACRMQGLSAVVAEVWWVWSVHIGSVESTQKSAEVWWVWSVHLGSVESTQNSAEVWWVWSVHLGSVESTQKSAEVWWVWSVHLGSVESTQKSAEVWWVWSVHIGSVESTQKSAEVWWVWSVHIGSVESTQKSAELDTLHPHEATVLRWRFGLGGKDGEGVGEVLTLRQIAAKMGLSYEMVRRYEARGLLKLQVPARAQALQESLQGDM
ncbi:unnamed protein product, partial [Closterium sp. NIES-54]